MNNSKAFWLLQNIVVIIFWIAVLLLIATGQSEHRLLLVAKVIVAVHVLELPIALRLLRDRGVSTIKVGLMTLVFGYTWWMPVHRRIYTG